MLRSAGRVPDVEVNPDLRNPGSRGQMMLGAAGRIVWRSLVALLILSTFSILGLILGFVGGSIFAVIGMYASSAWNDRQLDGPDVRSLLVFCGETIGVFAGLSLAIRKLINKFISLNCIIWLFSIPVYPIGYASIGAAFVLAFRLLLFAVAFPFHWEVSGTVGQWAGVGAWIGLIASVVHCILLPFVLGNRVLKGSSGTPASGPSRGWAYDPDVGNPSSEEPLPKNGGGRFNYPRLITISKLSKLRVVPQSAQGHIVVKVENWNNSRFVCWFLIREGRSAEISIPSGTYRLKLARGRQWYGEEHLFGPHTSYSLITNTIKIPMNTNYTIYLTPSENGTLREERIGPGDL